MEATRANPVCDCCRMEIERDAIDRDGKSYCCDGCAGGGPCTC